PLCSLPALVTSPFAPPSLHDALPISSRPTRAKTSGGFPLNTQPKINWDQLRGSIRVVAKIPFGIYLGNADWGLFTGACRILNKSDRKSTRLNSSHVSISYAVFCLKKK